LEGAFDVAGDGGDGGGGEEHADAGLEGLEVAGAGAGAFGEEDVDAFFVGEAFAEVVEGVCGGAAALHGEGVEGGGGEGARGGGIEECVGGGDGVGAEAEPPGELGAEDEGVEVGLVVGDEDEGAVLGEVVEAFDVEAVIEAEVDADEAPPDEVEEDGDEAGLATGGFKAFFEGEVEVVGGFEVERVHGRMDN